MPRFVEAIESAGDFPVVSYSDIEAITELTVIGRTGLTSSDSIILWDESVNELKRINLGEFRTYLTSTITASAISNSQIDARIATWARATNASGSIPDARIPSSIARDSEIPSASNANPVADGTASQGTSTRYSRQDHRHPAGASGLTTSQVDARIATWARQNSPSGTVPTARLPFTILQRTQAQYDAISTKNAATLYVIIG